MIIKIASKTTIDNNLLLSRQSKQTSELRMQIRKKKSTLRTHL